MGPLLVDTPRGVGGSSARCVWEGGGVRRPSVAKDLGGCVMNRVRASIVAAALIAIAPAAAAGQSLPRTSDGKPELSGIWSQ